MPEQIIILKRYQAIDNIFSVFIFMQLMGGAIVLLINWYAVAPLWFANNLTVQQLNYLFFFNCFNSNSSSSRLMLFSFTIKETALLKLPSK